MSVTQGVFGSVQETQEWRVTGVQRPQLLVVFMFQKQWSGSCSPADPLSHCGSASPSQCVESISLHVHCVVACKHQRLQSVMWTLKLSRVSGRKQLFCRRCAFDFHPVSHVPIQHGFPPKSHYFQLIPQLWIPDSLVSTYFCIERKISPVVSSCKQNEWSNLFKRFTFQLVLLLVVRKA